MIILCCLNINKNSAIHVSLKNLQKKRHLQICKKCFIYFQTKTNQATDKHIVQLIWKEQVSNKSSILRGF